MALKLVTMELLKIVDILMGYGYAYGGKCDENALWKK